LDDKELLKQQHLAECSVKLSFTTWISQEKTGKIFCFLLRKKWFSLSFGVSYRGEERRSISQLKWIQNVKHIGS
jgi:hypothetical protein